MRTHKHGLQHRPGKADTKTSLDLISVGARLLFANGQTTERVVVAVKQLSRRLGFRAEVFPEWGKLTLHFESDNGPRDIVISAIPAAVDLNKVAATMREIENFNARRADATSTLATLHFIGRLPPVSLARFALMSAAGAAALGILFGVIHPLSLILIALVAGLSACLRRWLAEQSQNLYIQPLCAALLAGIVGSVCARLGLGSPLRLIAVCPCMVLVPGPHFLNGALDLARARITLGVARLAFAVLFTLMICAGLVIGLALGGTNLPASGSFNPVPFGYDVLAAGVAVAAYGSFFNMPWHMLPIPIVVGMLAHASRWAVISLAGASVAFGALVACLVVGLIITPIANYLRLPFAGVAFASVVSLIPGIFLFRLAGGMTEIVTSGSRIPQELVSQIFIDGTTAMLIILSMAFGLIVPKLCIEHFTSPKNLEKR